MNRASIRAFANRGAAVIAEAWGEDVTYDGRTFTATVNDPQTMQSISDGGMMQEGDIVVSILKILLPTTPVIETRVVRKGTAYRVRSVQGDKEISPRWRLVCEPEN
jgi:hypothetical protein